MPSNIRILLIVGVVAAVCAIAAAFIMLNQSNDNARDLSGNWTEYELDGKNDAGMESFTESGKCKISFGYHDRDGSRYQMEEAGSSIRIYTELGKEIPIPKVDLYWASEFGTMEKTGHETISTAAGDKECDILKETVGAKETRTYWVDDGKTVYRMVHEISGEGKGNAVYTYSYVKSGHDEIQTGCTLTTVTGSGVDVKGNKGTYATGDYAELEAEYSDEGFGGWYDAKWVLISEEPKLRIMLTTDTILYAINGLGWDVEPDMGEQLNLQSILGVDADSFIIADTDTGSTESSEGDYVFKEGGQYRIYASKDGTATKVFHAFVDNLVTREFSWEYDGGSYTLRLDIDYSDVQYAKNYYTPHERTSERPEHERDKTFVTLSYSDPNMAGYTEKMVNSLIDSYKENHSEIEAYDFLNYILVFTQNIEYRSDFDSTGYDEYWKFPLETVFDRCGDCEDTMLLFVAIAHQCRDILEFDYRLSLQLMPDHACAGVIVDTTTEYQKNPDGFIFGETTATGYDLGEIPDKVKDYFLDVEGKYYPSVCTTVEIE